VTKLAVVLAAALLVCGICGYAIAASTKAPPSIKACAKKKGGALRLAARCKAGERAVRFAKPVATATVVGPQGPPGASGAGGTAGATGPVGTAGKDGTDGKDGAPGASGTSTGETFYASAGLGTNFGGGSCSASPTGGPSLTFTAPAGSYVQVMASVTMQRTTGSANAVCVNVDGSTIASTGLASTSLVTDTRYLVSGDTGGTTDKYAATPLTFPVSAGSHTISLQYASTAGSSAFSNRNLYVTVLHPTQ
jgi:hypothetical protein